MMNDLQRAARRAISLLDLTSLNDSDTEEKIQSLCARARCAEGQVAAVCVLPAFVPSARFALGAQGYVGINVATVVNFPAGDVDLVGAYDAVSRVITDGADEVDLVFPWRALMSGDWMVGQEMVQACVRACADKAALKVIIESGQLASPALIRQASEICVEAGAQFIKTSTGKTDVGATPAAVQVMAEVLKDSGATCGLKVSGGVRTAEEALEFINLVESVLGEGWVMPSTFRIGASSLLNSLQVVINNTVD